MRTRRLTVVFLPVLLASCAMRSDPRLDALNPAAEGSWEFIKGSPCDFAGLTVHVSGQDQHQRGFGVVRTIVAAMRGAAPEIEMTGAVATAQLRAFYQSGYSICTHCTEEWIPPRWGFADVQVNGPKGPKALAVWSDPRGGTAEQVAERFGVALATLVRAPGCLQSPDNR